MENEKGTSIGEKDLGDSPLNVRLKKFLKLLEEKDVKLALLNDNLTLNYFAGFKIISDFYLLLSAESGESLIKKKDFDQFIELDDKDKSSGSETYSKSGDNNYLGLLMVGALEYKKTKKEIADRKLPILVIKHRTPEEYNKLAKIIRGFKAEKIGIEYEHVSLKKLGSLGSSFLSEAFFKGTDEYYKVHPEDKSKVSQDKINKVVQQNIPFREYNWDNFYNLSEVINKMRLIKYPDEVEKLKKSGEIADKAMSKGISVLREGITEAEVAAEIEYEMRKLGAEGRSFETIVASGPNSWFPHATATERVIHEGDIVTLDLGAIYKGYCSDTTRTVIVGSPPYDEKLKKIINEVNNAQKAALEIIKPGIECNKVDAAARNYLKDIGWDKYFIHSLGHGVGLEVHDPGPFLTPSQTGIKLEEGMVVTVEPGVYIPGVGGARTEDTILITSDGYLSLNNSKKYYYN
ncbi:MAG: M24 family metallopeptidase [Promethearchaeota archaeon]